MSDTPGLDDDPEATAADRHRHRLIRLNHCWSQMPYGGISNFAYLGLSRHGIDDPSAEDALDVTIANLESLARVLRGVAERNEATADELRDLRGWLAGATDLAHAILALTDADPPPSPTPTEPLPAIDPARADITHYPTRLLSGPPPR